MRGANPLAFFCSNLMDYKSLTIKDLRGGGPRAPKSLTINEIFLLTIFQSVVY